VNPVVAVLLGVFFASEKMSPIQLLGLAIILISVLLINLAKYRASAAAARSRQDEIPLAHDVHRGDVREGNAHEGDVREDDVHQENARGENVREGAKEVPKVLEH
jgi:hypothetical protein